MNTDEKYPDSCMNCSWWGRKKKVKRDSNNKEEGIEITQGTCYNPDTKLTFIHTNEKTSCIITQSNAVCDKFERRLRNEL